MLLISVTLATGETPQASTRWIVESIMRVAVDDAEVLPLSEVLLFADLN